MSHSDLSDRNMISLTFTSAAAGHIGAAVDVSGTRFRVWAPAAQSVAVDLQNNRIQPLTREGDGYWSGIVEEAGLGTLYKFRLDGGESFPDPASRFQPDGPHGWSEVIDPSEFSWADNRWRGAAIQGQVIYEMHIGTFTREGTWNAAAERLPYLRDTGITLLEVMPVADFPGRFGWGYDGVGLYAPVALYGRPDDFRAFVNRAHELGIGVLLDVVYNHLGPDGNYLTKFSASYFSREHNTDWGAAINFDGEDSGPVRDFFCANAAYWIREFHLDGLRFDATQDIHDSSSSHILRDLCTAARAAAGARSVVLIGENEPQNTTLIRPVKEGGYGFDGLWNDDFHHSAMVALSGKADAYYSDYRGAAQEFISAAKYGYLFQGQRYNWQKAPRGTPTLGLPPTCMVNFIQNHDQIANSARGQRAHEISSPGCYKALTAVTLLMPGTPMLFQGQEFCASSRFFYFADHKKSLAEKVRIGRLEFMGQWRTLRQPEMQRCFTDPGLLETFERSRLDHTEVEKHATAYALHRDLLTLRKADPVFSRGGADGIDGAVINQHCFLLRYFSIGFDNDRLLVVNLDVDAVFTPAPEPLLAPPLRKRWTVLWSSEDPRYGGCGTTPFDADENWILPGRAAVVLAPEDYNSPNL